MNRRAYLKTLTAPVLVAGVAGCTGGGDGTTPTKSTTTSTPSTTTTPNPQAVEHYEAAVDALVRNKEKLDEWAEDSFEGSLVGTLQDRVSTARDELDEAAANAEPAGDLMQRIEQARYVADFQELSLAYYEGVTALFQLISTGRKFGDSEQHQRAADKFAQAQGLVDDLRGVIDDMGTVLGQIDNDVLDEPDLAYTGEPLDHLDLGDRSALDGADSYLEGFENVHLAFVQLETGQKHYENEEFADARAAWETGRSNAKTSESSFEAAVDNQHLPETQRNESIQALGFIETIIKAYDKLVEGATEAEAGNFEKANKLVKEGFEILGQL